LFNEALVCTPPASNVKMGELKHAEMDMLA
jgi:hypothetical protein